MRKLLIALAALTAAALAATLGFGSSHREAPGITLDPSADNTDTYAWTAKDAPGALTVAADWIPGQVPANGPNFFGWDDRARYYIHIDNTGDGRPDVSYRYQFKTTTRNKNSFLYALPGASGYNDPKLNVIQRYSIVRETYRYNGKKVSVKAKKIAEGLPSAPPNIGPKTFPNYSVFADGAVKTIGDGTKVFVGQRDDPFFVDLGATFDGINVRKLTGNKGQGKDDLSGMNTHSIVMQIPERLVTQEPQGRSPARTAAQRGGRRVVHHGAQAAPGERRLGGQAQAPEAARQASGHDGWVQVSRLGNPLVNEVVIPLGKKDQFNRTTPDRDAALYGKFVVKPELAAILNALFNVNAPENNRTDIVQALLQGIPMLNQHSGIDGPPAVDTIKLNLGVPPAATENRFGVIGGDTAGFPNGRRLGDDVVDIELQVVAGFLKDNKVPLGDGVDQNDKPFLSSFPYLASPHDGFNSAPSTRIEPGHAPVPGGRLAQYRDEAGSATAPAPPRAPSEDSQMTLSPPNLIKLLAPLAVFAAVLAVLLAVERRRRAARCPRSRDPGAPTGDAVARLPARRARRPRQRRRLRRPRRRLSRPRARDRRPGLLLARGARLRRRPAARARRPRRPDRRRHAGRAAPRLRRAAAPRPRGCRGRRPSWRGPTR